MLVLKKDRYVVRTVQGKTADDFSDWESGVLYVGDCSVWKRFSVEFSVDTSEPNALVCRPKRPYEDRVFELFFAFGGHCHGFTDQRVVLIKNVDPRVDLTYC